MDVSSRLTYMVYSISGAAKISMLETQKALPRTVVITQGTLPTIVAVNGKVTLFPIIDLDPKLVVDTNGAGDAYVGGFLSKLVQGCTMDVCCAMGAKAAAMCVQMPGCSFPTDGGKMLEGMKFAGNACPTLM